MSYKALRDHLLERPEVRKAYDAQLELGRLGQLLQRTRLSKHLRQVDLAAAADIAQSEISRMEAGLGDRGPTFDTLLRIAHAQKMRLTVELVPEEEVVSLDEPVEIAAYQRRLREVF